MEKGKKMKKNGEKKKKKEKRKKEEKKERMEKKLSFFPLIKKHTVCVQFIGSMFKCRERRHM